MDTQKWYQSKTIIGALVTVAAMILEAFGYSLGADEKASLTDMVIALVGFTGVILTIFGRVKATKSIDKKLI